ITSFWRKSRAGVREQSGQIARSRSRRMAHDRPSAIQQGGKRGRAVFRNRLGRFLETRRKIECVSAEARQEIGGFNLDQRRRRSCKEWSGARLARARSNSASG